MKHNLKNQIKLSLGFSIVTLAMTATPVMGASEGSIENQVEQDAPQKDPDARPSENSADTAENPTENVPESEPEISEGASSFSTLCGNGQGKPGENEVRKKRKGLFGLADRMSAMTRKIPLIGDKMVDTANSLSQAFACRLYPEEQKQADEATQEATRSAEVGKTVEWKSSVRENVSGSSTIAAKNTLPNGTPCLTITDVAIVDGDEMRVSKKMCKLPGAHRYTVVNV